MAWTSNLLVSHVATPAEFYLRLASNEEQFIEFEHRLADAHSASPSDVAQPRPGDDLVAFVKDPAKRTSPRWRRVRVLSVDEDRQRVVARLLDVGLTRTVLFADLRHFADREFLTKPSFVFRCHLLDLTPPRTGSGWPQIACEFFSGFISSRPLCIRRQELEEEDSGVLLNAATREPATPFSTELYLLVNVSDVLVEEELASRSGTDAEERDSGVSICSRVNSSHLFPNPVGRNLFPKWRPFEFSPDSSLDGVEITAIVRHAGVSGVIWVAPLDIAASEIEEKLQTNIKEFCDAAPKASELTGELDLNQAVFARFESKWLRASVVDLNRGPDETKIRVLYIDFGLTKWIFAHDLITVIPPSFLEIPQMVLDIVIHSTRPIGYFWDFTSLGLVHELTFGRVIRCIISPPFSQARPLQVDAILAPGDDGTIVHVEKFLVDSGRARWNF